jgi:ribosome-binding protein aMBF1 (putative translation factor)
MKRRGRHAHTEPLSSDDLRLIGQLKAHRIDLDAQRKGLSNRALAQKFGVSSVTISRVPEWGHD